MYAKKMEACISELKWWMASQSLQMNDAKTEVLCFTPKRHPVNVTQTVSVHVGSSAIQLTPCARNLGIMMDQHLSTQDFVTKTCQVCYVHLRDISSIRDALTTSAANQLVHSLVSSRLDYCNSLLVGCPQQLIAKLQRLQNMAARVVLGRSIRSFDHSIDRLHHLHWLPIPQRIQFKVLLTAFKAMHGLTPVYLSEMLHEHLPPRPLRSGQEHRLALPPTRPRTSYGDRNFKTAAPRLWNEIIPLELRNQVTLTYFKSKLKTELFKTAFMSIQT